MASAHSTTETAYLAQQAASYLQRLCADIPERPVGSAGNRAATDFFAHTVASFGFHTETPAFDCIDWSQSGAQLTIDGLPIAATVSPYSPGCRVQAPLIVVTTPDELANAPIGGAIVVLRGAIAAEPLMPKRFPFYNPEHHQQIIGLLEAGKPAAIIAATGRHPELAGGLYPFPLLEDGDFDIPSVYLTDIVGESLHTSAAATLTINAQRTPARAWNVIARKGDPTEGRIVVFAHIDAKSGTPGALDNAAGVVTLLLLAELCRNDAGKFELELVAMNGEDYYSAPGEQRYLHDNAGRFDTIMLGINIDGIGYAESPTAYSLYHCPPPLAETIQQRLAAYPDIVEGIPWYQGDHGIFLMYQRPTIAFTSEQLLKLTTEITHTPQDRPELVNCRSLAHTAQALADLLR